MLLLSEQPRGIHTLHRMRCKRVQQQKKFAEDIRYCMKSKYYNMRKMYFTHPNFVKVMIVKVYPNRFFIS